MDQVFEKLLILLTTLLVNLRLSTSAYLEELCWQNGVPGTIACQQDEIIRIRKTILSAVPVAPGVPLVCENLDRFNFCRAPTNLSDVEFVGRQRATYSVEAEDLTINPERAGDCLAGVRSNMAQVYYECVPTTGSNYLQSICANRMWENEVSGYLNSPYFPNTYPDSENYDLDCYCELRPEAGSRVELLGVLVNPSTTGRTWTLEADTGTGYTQDLSSQFYVSRRLTMLTSSSTVRLRFRSQGQGQQQPSRIGPPPGFWLEYRAVQEGSPLLWTPESLAKEGRVTLFCNDPYIEEHRLAAILSGVLGPLLIIAIIVIVCLCCRRKRRRKKEESYAEFADRPVQPNRAKRAPAEDVHRNRAFQESEDNQPYTQNHYHPRVSAYDYPEKEPYGRSNSSRTYSNDSYNDKVFLDDVDRKSIPSSGRTGDNDSIAKKSLSGSSQDDNYSEVNYSPKGPRHSSLGRDTAV